MWRLKTRQCSLALAVLATVLASASSAAPPAPAKKVAPAANASPAAVAPPAAVATPPAKAPAATPAEATIDAKPPEVPHVTTPAVPARLDTYVQPDGTGYFVLTFPPEADLPAASRHDIVVLFDTSASQVGETRARGLKALRTMLSLCQSPDRINLMAVDVGVTPLTAGFVAPDSSELKAALEQLARRVPLGATDFPLALERAAAAFSSDQESAKAVVYIGDGVSGAQVFTPLLFAKTADKLATLQVSVFSYGLGPRVDGQLLAALANYTGGTIVLDEEQLDPKEAGLFLAGSARGPVAWIQTTTWPKMPGEVYPLRVTPLRGDRESVAIGKANFEGPIEVEATGQAGGKPWQRRWSAAPNPSSDDFSYLPLLVVMARKDNGTTLPILGSKGLKQVGRMFLSTAAELTALARQALSTENFDDADRLTDEALRRDPNDPEATALRREIAKRRAEQKPLAKMPSAKPLATPSRGKSGKAQPANDKSAKSILPKGKTTSAKSDSGQSGSAKSDAVKAETAKPSGPKSANTKPAATAPTKPAVDNAN